MGRAGDGGMRGLRVHWGGTGTYCSRWVLHKGVGGVRGWRAGLKGGCRWVHKRGPGQKIKNPGRHKIESNELFWGGCQNCKNTTNIKKNGYWGGAGLEKSRNLSWYRAGPPQKNKFHYLGG